MLNKEYVQDILPFLVRSSMPKNARQFTYQVIDFSLRSNILGVHIDPRPFEGKVVAYDDEQQLMVVKLGRRSEYRVLDLAYVTQKPAIGKKVKVKPYARRDWNRERLDKPTIVESTNSNGMRYQIKETVIGGKSLKLPISEVNNLELFQLIEQLEKLPAPDGFRKIAHLLADAKATQFEVNENNQSISFYVDTLKHQGKVEIVYDRSSDLYAIFLTDDGIVNNEVNEIYFDQLGDVLSDLIDDFEWMKIKVEIL